MKTMLLTAALVAFASTAAGAVLIQIDDFDTPQGAVVDTTADGVANSAPQANYTLNGNAFSRDLSISLLPGFLAPAEVEAEVTAGVLDISNGVGDDSTTVVRYSMDSLIDNIAAIGAISDLAFLFQVIESDANPITIGAVLNGVDLGNFFVPANTFNQVLSFDIPNSSLVGGDLVLTINGEPGYDLALEALGLLVNETVVEAPAPAAIALFGFGVLGLGLARRRG